MSNKIGYNRRAYHAGSWYSDDKNILEEKLENLLIAAAKEEEESRKQKQENDATNNIRHSSLRGIICPHAGFDYSGPTAAHGYHHLKCELYKNKIRHIVVLHPSHKVYIDGCAISGANVIETPLGNLPVDTILRDEVYNLKPNAFTIMNQNVDECEHSGEMQYPFIAKVQNDANKKNGTTKMIPILSIMCGNISDSKETSYGKLLSEILSRPDVFSIISTDFCHWGQRFSYQPTPAAATLSCTIFNEKVTQREKTVTELFKFIQNLDGRGMECISLKQPGAFAKYLKQTRNTICGRHAIQTWLHAVVHSESQQSNHKSNGSEENDSDIPMVIDFIKYSQSSQVTSMRESSVSYASGIARVFKPQRKM